MKELTGLQAIKLIEDNLNGKFKYHLDNMREEKRPFGNSLGIEKDIMRIRRKLTQVRLELWWWRIAKWITKRRGRDEIEED